MDRVDTPLRALPHSPQAQQQQEDRFKGIAGGLRIKRNTPQPSRQAVRIGETTSEPWCLVASEGKVATRTLIRGYAKRWGIETSFRDIKDMRLGMGVSAMRISRVQRRDRMLWLSALSIAWLTLPGAAGERLGDDRWLKTNTVKRRTHSLFRQGLMLDEYIPSWPEHLLRPLIERFAQMRLRQCLYREIFGVI